MNRLTTAKRVAVVAALVESNSIRSTVRMTGVAKNTVVKLLVKLGAACAEYQHATLVSLPCKRIQADEIWVVCRREGQERPGRQVRPVRDRLGVDVDGDLRGHEAVRVVVADRSAGVPFEFMYDVATRLRNRVQLTTDGNTAYLAAVEGAFGSDIDYAMLQKVYGVDPQGKRRYSPPVCLGCKVETIQSAPRCRTTSTRRTSSARTSRCA